MSGVELIAAALAAGASAGLTTTASAAVGDAYAGLKRVLGQHLAGRALAAVLEADETDAGTWQAQLGPDLLGSGAANDEQVLAAARDLLTRADPTAAKTFDIDVEANYGAAGAFNAPVTFNQGPSATYRVDVSEAKGVQVGDHNIQTNTFN